jgi:hypothetical protein
VVEAQQSCPAEPPPLIPGYTLLDKIGEGGMGEVYRAAQLSLQRTVAVKFLNPEFDAPSAFHRESRLMAALAHSHVVTIHDCGRAGGRHYLIMEYVDGSTLRSRMEPGKPWPVAEAAAVLEAVAQALSYIHERGILHLDLKPENVLCAGRAFKITDFGLAAPQVDVRTLSEKGLARGTLDYCPPEQRHGLPLDRRSDVFALAALAYELLTGHVPSRVYYSVARRNRRAPRAADAVLSRGLARHPEERYETVEAFRADLARALSPPRRRFGRGPVLLLGGAAVVFAACLGVFLLSFPRTTEPARPPLDPSPGAAGVVLRAAPFGGRDSLLCPCTAAGSSNFFLLRPEGGEALEVTKDDSENFFPAYSPDGRQIAFTSARGGKLDIYSIEAGGGPATRLSLDEGNNQAPSWSPDGTRIAFTTDRNGRVEIYVIDADGSNPVNLSRNLGFDGDPAWSPDGKTIAFAAARDGVEGFRLFVMDADGANPRPVRDDLNPYGYVYPAWSPDGKQIAYGSNDGSNIEIFVCDADGSTLHQLTRLGGVNCLPAWSPDGTRIAFQHTRAGAEMGSLYVMDADGGGPVEVLKATGAPPRGRPAWKGK